MDRTLISYMALGCSFLCRSVSLVLVKFTRWGAKGTFLRWKKRRWPCRPDHLELSVFCHVGTLSRLSHIDYLQRGSDVVGSATELGQRGVWALKRCCRWSRRAVRQWVSIFIQVSWALPLGYLSLPGSHLTFYIPVSSFFLSFFTSQGEMKGEW